MYFVEFSDALRGKHTKLKKCALCLLTHKANDKQKECEQDSKQKITKEKRF